MLPSISPYIYYSMYIHCLLGGLRLLDLNEKVLFCTFSGAVVAVFFTVFIFSFFKIFLAVAAQYRVLQKILMTRSLE